MYRGFDTPFNHTALGLASDGSGTLYVSGYTEGSFGGSRSPGVRTRTWRNVTGNTCGPELRGRAYCSYVVSVGRWSDAAPKGTVPVALSSPCRRVGVARPVGDYSRRRAPPRRPFGRSKLFQEIRGRDRALKHLSGDRAPDAQLSYPVRWCVGWDWLAGRRPRRL